ncbi:MAG TPA: hypothetical protein VK034_28295 [Enhygromyxa sp.]|nr:hypothetical protein [Enhygromyxa sp.]
MRRDQLTLGVLLTVGAFDVATGFVLLLADRPWDLAGFAALWERLPAAAADDPAVKQLVTAALSRIAAFSIAIGAATLVWAWLSRRDRQLRTALLVTYTLAGLAFAWSDNVFFAGTDWGRLKSGFGVLWVLALVAHFAPRRTATSGE